MIAVDTNILARFYLDAPNDADSTTQRSVARKVLGEPTGVFVSKTWVRVAPSSSSKLYHISSVPPVPNSGPTANARLCIGQYASRS